KDARFRTDQRTYAHAAAPPAASYDASPLDDFAYLTYDAPAAASHSVDDSPSFYDTGSATSFDSCDTGSNASFDSCDTGSSGSFASGDCGSGGGSFD
ncbi:MAG TPA: hypothetical protein VGX50_14470, partial [Longimicrobium sp.]|nr:hypothetical protein [Longimicrobium sp.]